MLQAFCRAQCLLTDQHDERRYEQDEQKQVQDEQRYINKTSRNMNKISRQLNRSSREYRPSPRTSSPIRCVLKEIPCNTSFTNRPCEHTIELRCVETLDSRVLLKSSTQEFYTKKSTPTASTAEYCPSLIPADVKEFVAGKNAVYTIATREMQLQVRSPFVCQLLCKCPRNAFFLDSVTPKNPKTKTLK